MVCQRVLFFLQAITCGISVAGLRDRNDPVQSSSSGFVEISKSTDDLLQTVNDAVRSDEGQRGMMLEKAVGILLASRTEGKNASQYMTPEQRAKIKEVIKLVNISIFGEIYSEHNTDKQLVANSTLPQQTCLLMLQKRSLTGGDIFEAKKAHGEKKTAHVDCRTGGEKPAQMLAKAAFDSAEKYRSSWMQTAKHMLPSPTFKSKEEDELNKLFDKHTPSDTTAEGQKYYNWFYDEKGTWEPKYKNYTTTKKLHEDKRVECNNKQLAFESQHCMLYSTQVDACKTYDGCYKAAIPGFNEVNTLVTANIEKRKFAYQKGMVVMDLINCFLGNACENATAGSFADKQFNITLKTLPAKEACAPEYKSLPCDEQFRQKWYVPYLPENAPANAIKHCAKCQGLEPIKVAAHCLDSAVGSDVDEMNRNCAYYTANPSHCRGQGPQSYSVKFCCACGGGYNGITAYKHYPRGCILGHDMESTKEDDLSLPECAAKCDKEPKCHSFDYGVNYNKTKWAAKRCMLGTSGRSDLIIADCATKHDANVDMYVKKQPAPGYKHYPKGCISGYNIDGSWRYGLTLAQCAARCTKDEDCQSFEFGVDYKKTYWTAGTCVLGTTGRSERITLDCASKYAFNIDLHVKDSSVKGYTQVREAWIRGADLPSVQNSTVEQCAELCKKNADCKAFEFGVLYYNVTKDRDRKGECTPQNSSKPIRCGNTKNKDVYVKDGETLLYLNEAACKDYPGTKIDEANLTASSSNASNASKASNASNASTPAANTKASTPA